MDISGDFSSLGTRVVSGRKNYPGIRVPMAVLTINTTVCSGIRSWSLTHHSQTCYHHCKLLGTRK